MARKVCASITKLNNTFYSTDLSVQHSPLTVLSVKRVIQNSGLPLHVYTHTHIYTATGSVIRVQDGGVSVPL